MNWYAWTVFVDIGLAVELIGYRITEASVVEVQLQKQYVTIA